MKGGHYKIELDTNPEINNTTHAVNRMTLYVKPSHE